jgi:hypothetical protein
MTKILKSIMPVVALFVLTINGQASQYVTLFAGEGVDISPTSLVELVSSAATGSSNGPRARYTYNRTINAATGTNQIEEYIATMPTTTTGLTRIENTSPAVAYSSFIQLPTSQVTLKITLADEINAVAPSSVFVIPENSTGDYDVLLETSSDMGTWSPFLSQTVSAADAKRFFRARIVKKN